MEEIEFDTDDVPLGGYTGLSQRRTGDYDDQKFRTTTTDFLGYDEYYVSDNRADLCICKLLFVIFLIGVFCF